MTEPSDYINRIREDENDTPDSPLFREGLKFLEFSFDETKYSQIAHKVKIQDDVSLLSSKNEPNEETMVENLIIGRDETNILTDGDKTNSRKEIESSSLQLEENKEEKKTEDFLESTNTESAIDDLQIQLENAKLEHENEMKSWKDELRKLEKEKIDEVSELQRLEVETKITCHQHISDLKDEITEIKNKHEVELKRQKEMYEDEVSKEKKSWKKVVEELNEKENNLNDIISNIKQKYEVDLGNREKEMKRIVGDRDKQSIDHIKSMERIRNEYDEKMKGLQEEESKRRELILADKKELEERLKQQESDFFLARKVIESKKNSERIEEEETSIISLKKRVDDLAQNNEVLESKLELAKLSIGILESKNLELERLVSTLDENTNKITKELDDLEEKPHPKKIRKVLVSKKHEDDKEGQGSMMKERSRVTAMMIAREDETSKKKKSWFLCL